MSIILISLIALLIIIILVPQRIRYALNQMFAFLVIPFRDLSSVTGGYVSNFPDRSRRLLNSSGISQPPYFGKAIGAIIITGVTLVSIMADLELVILTLEGVGIGERGKAIVSLLPLKPAECMSIALIGGAAMLGILFFDHFKPVLLPDNMIWPEKVGKVVMIASAVMLIGAVIAMGALAKSRASSIDTTMDKDISKMIESNKSQVPLEDIDLSDLNSPLQSHIRTYLFVYIALLTLINGILGFLVLSPFSGLLLCFLLAVFLVPVGIIYFVSNMMDRLITLLFNIFVAIFNVVQGVFNGLSRFLHSPLDIADSVEEENNPQVTNPDESQQEVTPSQNQTQNQPGQPNGNEDNPEEGQVSESTGETLDNDWFNPLD